MRVPFVRIRPDTGPGGSALIRYRRWQASDRNVLRRIYVLIMHIKRDGNEGIGKPEALKSDAAGYWSRRITDEHRIVDKVVEGKIRIAASRYHSG